jgi:hypothetical protein
MSGVIIVNWRRGILYIITPALVWRTNEKYDHALKIPDFIAKLFHLSVCSPSEPFHLRLVNQNFLRILQLPPAPYLCCPSHPIDSVTSTTLS